MTPREKKYNTRSIFKFDIKKAKELGLQGNIKQIVENVGYRIVNYEMLRSANCALIEVEKNRISPPAYLIEMNNCWEFKTSDNENR